ncbi:hypothetical protein K469DRAFT_740895 [Zopfia rhizophila CBS 207.26]|uniref:Uncharacterized protein n=1 Tax=Zopfia rhizophila CBS 207.26 TaxID=1314779 RepID=A0A6A6DRY3_9PEZI|nr:hypothetical protein K469DRAFT_740895 [Zopfia rhizophila CBS 207.26]
MDGLSATASVTAIIGISAKIASLCFQYSAAVKDAKKDIKRLEKTVTDVKNVLDKIQQLLDKHDKTQFSTTDKLSASLEECTQQLEDLRTQLEPGKARKAMHCFGVRALKWPFTSQQVEKIVASLKEYEQTFSLALQIDQTGLTLGVDQKLSLVDKKADNLLSKIDIVKLPIAEGAFFDSHMEEHNARCLSNTRVELLSQITEWAKDRNGKPIFWLNDMAGTGKSTIARTIAQSFAKNNQLGASFFFKKGESDCRNATRFFTTITTGLMRYVPGLMLGIKKAINTDPAISTKTLKDQFKKLILDPLSETAPAKALELIVVTILQLLSRTKGLKLVSLRVFVTSRPELPIRLRFKQMPDRTYQDLVLHEHKLAQIRKQRLLSVDWPSKGQIQALVELAIPLFIFTATAYDKIVRSIIVLESLLSIASLVNLLNISKDDISCRLDSLHSVLSISNSEDGKYSFWVNVKEIHKSLKSLQQNMCNLLIPRSLKREINKQTVASYLLPEL